MNNQNNIKQTPVLLITGYLGSGKTTLVNRILSNKKGIRFAVIVNDIGEVNIDADLIEKGGIVGKKDESLVSLQNGCICCTLKTDLIEQLYEITRTNRFDYIVIEASGICEPEPIARTICSMPMLIPAYKNESYAAIDSIVTVVDALRLQSEFDCGNTLPLKNFDEQDLENLVIQQIEFCNVILINKASEVRHEELGRIKEIVHALQPKAEIMTCDFGNVDLDKLLNTHLFDFDEVATSAAWINEIEGGHEHQDKHEHEHHHEGGEVEEYGISTFVYYRRPAFDLNKFDAFVAKKWPRNIIRAKGICYFSNERDKCYLFEQAGIQKSIKDAGLWFANMPQDQLMNMMERDANLRRDWDDEYGDRMIKIVFIGQNINKDELIKELDFCLED